MGNVILFQGDSITDAGRNRELSVEPNKGMGAGYPALICSYLRCHDAAKDWQIYNRGISGNRVVDLYARWKIDALNLKPDLISILIGVNDTWHERSRQNGVEVPRFEKIYRMLLEWTREVLPEVKLVLMEPFVLPFGAADETWVAEVAERAVVVRKLAEEFNAVFIPTQEMLTKAAQTASPEYWLVDGVHPTAAGHQLLADAWLAGVRKQGWLK